MELHYKVYRKVKIYFNKVCGALPNLGALKERSEITFGSPLVVSRIEEMQLIQAQLVNYFMNPALKVPYVPSSRCLALSTWYGDDSLLSCDTLDSLNTKLITEDDKVIQEANYMISDPLLPAKLQTLFENHSERLRKIRLTKEALKEL
ncbi:hypothetical protein D9O36_07015 [Zobellia amurskyensis]|uniref:Uncharacterized protein n=1 Tax=Zobellia amurskyensis TaxID=248905 RepID=A0A7X3D0Y1_9FLAO|nr:hypothetical protein [Zobellia amurskyensis]MUH35584.1 hypothetical protein [Zobellia amurskyensis]